MAARRRSAVVRIAFTFGIASTELKRTSCAAPTGISPFSRSCAAGTHSTLTPVPVLSMDTGYMPSRQGPRSFTLRPSASSTRPSLSGSKVDSRRWTFHSSSEHSDRRNRLPLADPSSPRNWPSPADPIITRHNGWSSASWRPSHTGGYSATVLLLSTRNFSDVSKYNYFSDAMP